MFADSMLSELDQEALTTRRVLERVPNQHLGWRPAPRGMTLGQLAWHVATIPGGICQLARGDGLDASGVDFEPRMPASADEILPAFDASLESARGFLRGFTAEQGSAAWRLTDQGQEMFTIPKAALIRTLMFNHWYHHRGQLVVYYRSVGVPVPAVYGRSADEKLFGA
jgi:uncharacterized damage-inducible protein DinB